MSEIVCFHGADHKCGVSMVTQSVAERLATAMPDKKILLVYARTGSCEYAADVRESIDTIRPYLAGKLVDPGEIMARAKWKKNLYIIGGPEGEYLSEDLHPDTARYLLDTLRAKADIILCDCGCEPQSGLSLGALLSADYVYYVTTQSETALRRLSWLMPLYQKLGMKKTLLIVNRYERNEAANVAYISERTGFEGDRIITVRNSEAGRKAETEYRSLATYSDSGLRRDMDAIAVRIAEMTGLRPLRASV